MLYTGGMTTTAAEIFEAHCENERRRRYADISQSARDECVYVDNELLGQLIDLEDAGDTEAGAFINRWADEVPA